MKEIEGKQFDARAQSLPTQAIRSPLKHRRVHLTPTTARDPRPYGARIHGVKPRQAPPGTTISENRDATASRGCKPRCAVQNVTLLLHDNSLADTRPMANEAPPRGPWASLPPCGEPRNGFSTRQRPCLGCHGPTRAQARGMFADFVVGQHPVGLTPSRGMEIGQRLRRGKRTNTWCPSPCSTVL